MSQPQRGEVWWVDLGIAGKTRPVVIVSAPITDADYALLATVPHTTAVRGSQFEVRMRVPRLKDGVFNIQGLASVPLAKFIRRIANLDAAQMATLDAAIKRWLPTGSG